MTTEFSPYLKLFCDDDAPGDCGPCGVELNGWIPYTLQRAAEGRDGCAPVPARIAGVTSDDLECFACDATEPAVSGCAPSTDIGGGATFSWAYDADEAITDEAYGFLIHSFTADDPRDFSASRTEKLRGRVRLVDGLLLCEILVESVGANRFAARHQADILRTRLETVTSWPVTGEVWLGCSSDPGKPSLRRWLTNVGEFHVQGVTDRETITEHGVLQSVVFSADPHMEIPDRAVAAGAAAALGDSAGALDCVNTTTVPFTEFAAKNNYQADLELQTDGNLKVCPVDYDAVDAATDYLRVREVRAADAVTDPCSVEIDLDVTGAVPVVTPLQPDLWATQITAPLVANGEIDCTNQPVIRSVRVRNPNYKPDCPTCPDDARARQCASDAGLVIDEFGIIDWAASGIDSGFEYVWTPGGGIAAEFEKVLTYWKCIGITAASQTSGPHGEGLEERGLWDLQGYFDDADHDGAIYSPDGSSSIPFTVDSVSVTLDSGGKVLIKVGEELSPGVVTPVNTSYYVYVETFPGYDGLNPLSTASGCGPGDAQLFGDIEEIAADTFSVNGDLTLIGGVASNGDHCTWTFPALTKTVVVANPTGSQDGAAINHTTNELWSTSLRTSGTTTLVDLYENGVLADTVSDTGGAEPVWDIASNRMLLVTTGLVNHATLTSVRDDIVIYEWDAGGVLTELDAQPLPTGFGSETANVSGFPVMATPSGGLFFIARLDLDTPAADVTTLNHWDPSAGFTLSIDQDFFVHEASGSAFRGNIVNVTPSGDLVYHNRFITTAPGEVLPYPGTEQPIAYYQINETRLEEETSGACSPGTLFHEWRDSDKGTVGMGTGFVLGIAYLEHYDEINDTVHPSLYLIDNTPPDDNPCGDTPDHCLPYIEISPAQSGPCVNITLAANGFATSDLSPLTNDLSRARFEFGPCSEISTPGCPAVIPANPVVTVDTVTGLATPVGWTPGYKWPADSVGSQYSISLIDAVANNPAGIATVGSRTIPLIVAECTPPCPPSSFVYAQALESDCWTPSISQTVDIYTVAGLSKSTRYRPVWSVEANTAMVQPQVFLWHGLTADASPTIGTVTDFLCQHSPTRIKALESGQVISYTSAGLRITCGDGTADALSEGWVDATHPWVDPVICGAEKAVLIVARTIAETQPTVTFNMVPIATP